MSDDAAPNARDSKLIDWLDEAYDHEVRLQADLSTQISLIEKPAYRKRVEAHLSETKEHERLVAKRIVQLGGQASGPGGPSGLSAVSEAVSAVGEAAGKAVAAVKGQIAARASAGEGTERQVRIAEDQLLQEHFEIAIYTRIQAFAEEVGDAETAKLTRAILRDEERMVKFLVTELPKLVRDIVRAEVPKDQRVTRTRRTRPASTPVRREDRVGSQQ
jgi:ferritin-like metal-binding protein YciE